MQCRGNTDRFCKINRGTIIEAETVRSLFPVVDLDQMVFLQMVLPVNDLASLAVQGSGQGYMQFLD